MGISLSRCSSLEAFSEIASLGLTFCVAPDVAKLAVDARWGRYERVPNDEHEVVKTRKNRATGHEEEVKVRVWRRIPCGGEHRNKLAIRNKKEQSRRAACN